MALEGNKGEKAVDMKQRSTYARTCLLYRTSLVTSAVKHLPMQEMRFQSLGREDLLGKEMPTHFSILAREISWTKEPGGLQSMGLQRIWT